MSSSHPSPYNFTIEDTSSMWQYTPFGDGDSRTGWQWVFSGPGVNDQTPLCDTHPEGVSFHTTGAYGANMTLEWLGVGIYLFGTSYSPYQVTVDGDTSTPFNPTSDGILFARNGLTHKTHTIVVTVLPDDVNSLFNFDYALLTDLVPANAGVRKPIEHPATDSSLFTYTPDSAWQIKSDAQIPISTHALPFRETAGAEASVSMNFTQSVGVTLNGTRGCDHGEYTINLTDLTRNLTYQHTYNGTTRWFMPDALLFYHAGLNPENVYQVTLTNAEDSTLSFVYAKTHRVSKQLSGSGENSTSTSNIGLQPTSTVTPQLPNPPNPSKLNIGIIIGPIVSGVLIVILVILLAIYLRRKPERKKSEIAPSNTPVGTISPYIPHPISPKVGHTSSSSARLGGKSRCLEITTPISQAQENTLTLPPPVTRSDPQTTTPNDPRTDIPFDIDRVVELVTQRILSSPSPSIPVAPPPQYTR